MEDSKIRRNKQLHCISGGNYEEYMLTYPVRITLNKKEIEDIKNDNISEDYKKMAMSIGAEIVNDLLNFIKNDEEI